MKFLKKRVAIRTLVCVGMLVIIWGSYAFGMKLLSYRFELRKDSFSYMYQIDSVETQGGKLVLSGWIFRLGVDAEKEKYEVLLYDKQQEKIYVPKMKYEKREDVNAYFLCEYDYTKCGFVASIRTSRLDLENTDYEILLRKNTKREAYQTGIFLSNGKIVYADPNGFVPPETAGTDLEEVVEKGILRAYRPEKDIYVYQYQERLYWFVKDAGSYFETDGEYIEYLLDTNQYDRLPERRKKNNWNWDNIGFNFTQKEWTGKDTGNYRVAVSELPTEYAVTKVWTGAHKNDIGWLWRADFRPYYTKELLGK
ncbi:MAG: hypothetical protein J1E35_01810 [Lachnospiraceae bacterium]|nr:hypothetical protein [Lachnospiraceae bacterium]